MSEKKRILIVDDNYETVDYLRSALELTRNTYAVIGVPSAEEGWLELLRDNIDLVIIDLRLPGMSGSELMHRIHRRFPNLPTIVMSGYSLEWMKRETAGLTVFRLLEKPLDTDQLLDVVDAAVFGKPQKVVETAAASTATVDIDLPARLRRRLEQLRQETGARRLLLGTLRGDLVYTLGEAVGSLDESGLSSLMGQNLRHSLALAETMGSAEALTVQVQTSRHFEVYMANLGHSFFVTLFYPAQSQRARIGTIWVFLQRAIRDLVPLLPSLDEVGDVQKAAVSPPASSVVSPPAAPPVIEPAFSPEPEPELPVPVPGPPLSLEEALAQGLVPADLADAFSAVEQGDPGKPTREEMTAEIDLFGELDEEPVDDLADFLDLTRRPEADPAEVNAFWKGIITGDTEGEADDDLIDEALQTGILISARIETDEEYEENEEDQENEKDGDLQKGGEVIGGGGGRPDTAELDALAALDFLDAEAADAFWDSALNETDFNDGRGLTLTEARDRGLLVDRGDDENEKD